jgi:hypothetical protein
MGTNNRGLTREYQKYLSGWQNPEYRLWTAARFLGSVVMVLGTLVLLPYGFQQTWTAIKQWQEVCTCSWVVVPPVFFAMEYFWLWPKIQQKAGDAETEKTEFDYFKYGQDLMTKVWAAASATTFVVFFGKDLGLHP